MMERKHLKLPHIYVILVGIMLVCAAASWVLPAGQFDRAESESGRMVVVPGSYHATSPTPVMPFDAVINIYKGFVDAGPIVFFVFIAFSSISMLISTGAFSGLVASLLHTLKGWSRAAIIPIFITIIGVGSSTIGLYEETMPFIPIFAGIATVMGYDALVGLAIVALGASLGYSGAAINPFTVGVAQSIAEVAPLSGTAFRVFCHLVMIAVASIYTVRYALMIQADPTKSLLCGDEVKTGIDKREIEEHPFGIREKLVLLSFFLGIAAVVYGCSTLNWYFEELSAVFMIMAVASAIIMGWGPSTIAKKMADGFCAIAMPCMMIGLARGILVTMQSANIIDTIVHWLSQPLAAMPKWLAAEAMLVIQTLLNFLIPSGTGQAAISMPIMVPLADTIGMSRQVAVLAYQFGDGLSNVLWPTALAPVFAGIAGIKIERWWKWFMPLFFALLITQMILLAAAVAMDIV